MNIRTTTSEDLPALMKIFQAARQYMVLHGNPHQWVNRPTADDIERDIAAGVSYVCIENGEIAGTFAYIPGPDPTYATIYDGAWPDEAPYGVIHRLAGSAGSHGVAAAAFRFALEKCDRLRIDTHQDNRVMQELLRKHGFRFCGTILLADGDPRWAYFKRKTED